jgi:pimeloyl-ACP methyl ester carboxylesterase
VLGEGGGAGGYLRRIFAGWGTFAPGSPEAQSEHWMRQSDADPVALEHVLDSVVATRAEEVSRIEVPVLVLMGTDDERARSAGDLVAALPNSALAMVPGDHGTAPAAPEFTTAIADFLARRPACS